MSTRLLRSNSPSFWVVFAILCEVDKLAFWDVKIVWMSLNDHLLRCQCFKVFFLTGGSLNIELFILRFSALTAAKGKKFH
jgi:hypothetical protein